MQSYQRRTQNRQVLRSSQSRQNIQLSQSSRTSSKKKYLEVCSKKSGDNQINNFNKNLSHSAVSLPIDFKQTRSTSLCHKSISGSQAQLVPNRSMAMIPTWQPDHLRGHSLPAKTIIIQETIKPVPVSFSYLQPSTIRIDYRQSLPINNGFVNKNEIIRNSIRQAATPIRMFSNSPANMIDTRRQTLVIERRPQIFVNSQNFLPPRQPDRYSYQPRRSITENHNYSQQRITNYAKPLNLINSQRNQTNILTNERYIECEVTLNQIGVNTDLSECKMKKEIQIEKPIIDQKKSNYNSLVVTQEDKQENFKENLEIKTRQCVCDKIRNFNQCSQIKINVKQVLKPKKNFVFV